ncbi:MAG: hypothetical protein ACT4NY_25850 [Pseudonocardiales bacterium]
MTPRPVTPPPARRGLTLDTGALIGLERGDERVRSILWRAVADKIPLAVPAGVVAQAWRGGPWQARIARLLADPDVQVVVLDDPTARAVGTLTAHSDHADVVDVSVALCAAESGHAILTSDLDDISAVNPRLVLIAV